MSDDPTADELESIFRRARDLDAPLAARLTLLARECRRLVPACATALDRLSARLAGSGTGTNAPGPGETLPRFVLPDECGLNVALDELLEDGPLALVFHTGHWSPFSRLNGFALADAQPRAAAKRGRIVSITPERRRFAAKLSDETRGRVRILTDPHNGYALSLGIAVWLGSELQRILADRGTDLPSFQGNDAWMVPLPATFVVGAGGRVVGRHVPTDFRSRMTIEDLLGSLDAAAQAYAS